MKRMNIAYIFMAAALLAAPVSYARKDFFGTIGSRPEGNADTWVVGGRNVDVTDKTRHGSLKSMALFPSAPVSKSNMKEKL